MKIVITGFSGAGKSTLARKLSEHYKIPVLHMDSVHFKENWEERDKTEFESIVQDFMKNNESWIIDGNYRKTATNRINEADQLIFLDYNRFTCLINVIKRYRQYKGTSRPDMAKGCKEKIDKEFFTWVIWKGRIKSRRLFLLNQAQNHKNSIVFKNRRQMIKHFAKNNIFFNK